MTPPTVQFIPAAAGGNVTLDMEGPERGTAFGYGIAVAVADLTFNTGSAPTGLTDCVIREDQGAVFWVFNSTANANAFKTAYPAGGTWTVYWDLNNDIPDYTKGITISGWSYVNVGGISTRPGISYHEFSADGTGTYPTGFLFYTGGDHGTGAVARFVYEA